MPILSIGGDSITALWVQIKNRLRLLVIGHPLATSVQLEHRLPIMLALPVFASDAISSVAYGPQEILLVLHEHTIGGMPLTRYMIPIALAIVALMFIVAFSYRRAVHLYPTSGGSYTVAKSNLGQFAGLVAAAALLIDYIMTVAVSISSGVDALISAVPVLMQGWWPVIIAILLVVFITLVNLRGAKESGLFFAAPMYLFTLMVGLMVLGGLLHYFTGTAGTIPPPPTPVHPETQTPLPFLLLVFILLHAFSNGCTAMTGTEAVSNGVSAFQPPEAKHAAQTLLVMILILASLFFGTAFVAHIYHVTPSDPNQPGITVVAQLATAIFGGSLGGKTLFFILQASTTLILIIAANTSFADFPRLMAFVARDGYAPKAFITQGDRLVYNRGIIALALISILIIVVFKANVNALLGLYAVGVFLCFTLSQAGMVKRMRELAEKDWRLSVAINSTGAVVTGIVTLIVLITKFTKGAWMVVVLVPLLMLIAYAIRRHYEWFESTMTVHDADYNPLTEPEEPLTVLVLVSSDIHRGILEGLECGRAIASTHENNILRAVHIEMDPEKTSRLQEKWGKFVAPYLGNRIQLDIVPSPYRWLIEPILDYLNWTDLERNGDRIIIVIPEFETGSWITQLLHNFTAGRLRTALLNRPHVTVVSSRFFMKPMAWRLGRGGLVY